MIKNFIIKFYKLNKNILKIKNNKIKLLGFYNKYLKLIILFYNKLKFYLKLSYIISFKLMLFLLNKFLII